MHIAVSNPSKQYTHQAIAAFHRAGYKVSFLTSFWYVPERYAWHRWLAKLPGVGVQLKKKSAVTVPADIVIMNSWGILFSLFGRFLVKGEKRSFVEDRIQDHWVARWIRKHQPDVLIGYEKSCLRSLKEIKKYKGLAILDLAQVHPFFIASLRQQYPFFTEITGSDQLFRKICAIKLAEYKQANCILTLSAFARKTLLENGVEPKKVKTVNLGFDPSKFLLKKYDSNNKRPLQLIFSGTVTRRKGVHLLLELMSEIQELDIELTIIGPVGDNFGFEEKIRENNRISYYTFLPHEKLAELLRASDVFIFPSFLDSWAMVVIEAMACGLPVIITTNTGARDAVTGNEGFILPVNDLPSLKEKVTFFYENREMISKMGLAARKTAEQYSWERYYSSIKRLFSQNLIESSF